MGVTFIYLFFALKSETLCKHTQKTQFISIQFSIHFFKLFVFIYLLQIKFLQVNI